MLVAEINDALQDVGRVFSGQRVVTAKTALQNMKKVHIKSKILVHNRLFCRIVQSKIKVKEPSNQPVNLQAHQIGGWKAENAKRAFPQQLKHAGSSVTCFLTVHAVNLPGTSLLAFPDPLAERCSAASGASWAANCGPICCG